MFESGVSIHFILPINSFYRTINITVVPTSIHRINATGQRCTRIKFFLITVIFVRRKNLCHIIYVTNTPVSIERNLCFSRFTTFGSNKNNAIRSFSSIDGGRRSIFQHINTLNITGRNIIDIIDLKTIHDVQRRVILCDRATTTHCNLNSSIGRAIGRYYIHTCQLSRNSRSSRCNRNIFQNLFTHRRNGTGQVPAARGAITYHHHFIQCLIIFFQYHFQMFARFHCHNSRFHTYKTNLQFGWFFGNWQRKISIQIGNCANRGFFQHFHTRTDNGVAIGIHHRSFHRYFLCTHRCRRYKA